MKKVLCLFFLVCSISLFMIVSADAKTSNMELQPQNAPFCSNCTEGDMFLIAGGGILAFVLIGMFLLDRYQPIGNRNYRPDVLFSFNQARQDHIWKKECLEHERRESEFRRKNGIPQTDD